MLDTDRVGRVMQTRQFEVVFDREGVLGLFFSPQAEKPFTVMALAGHGLAVATPEIQPGCILVAVQGEAVRGLSYEQGLQMIKSARRPLRLLFERGDFCACCLSLTRFCVCNFVPDAGSGMGTHQGAVKPSVGISQFGGTEQISTDEEEVDDTSFTVSSEESLWCSASTTFTSCDVKRARRGPYQ